eukprot:scaffold736_cov58-Attheya_sp.AAC.2
MMLAKQSISETGHNKHSEFLAWLLHLLVAQSVHVVDIPDVEEKDRKNSIIVEANFLEHIKREV